VSPIDLYTAAGCRGGERIRALLARTGRSVRTRDLFSHPLSWDALKHLAGMVGGVRHLLSTQAPGYRERGLDWSSVSELELLHLMAEDPRLLRRPIVVVDGVVQVGFEGHALDGGWPASTG
jgi:regulatory protein spx